MCIAMRFTCVCVCHNNCVYVDTLIFTLNDYIGTNAAIVSVGGLLSSILGGYLSDNLSKKDGSGWLGRPVARYLHILYHLFYTYALIFVLL